MMEWKLKMVKRSMNQRLRAALALVTTSCEKPTSLRKSIVVISYRKQKNRSGDLYLKNTRVALSTSCYKKTSYGKIEKINKRVDTY